jgi:CBS domain-containing protein
LAEVEQVSENLSEKVIDLADRPVSELGLRDCVTLGLDATGGEAVDQMIRHDRGAVVIVDEGGAVSGIFTERDVLEFETRAVVEGGADWRSAPLSELMTPDPVSVRLDTPIREVVENLREGRFRHLPVVDDEGRPKGLLSIRDVLSEIAEYFPQEVANLPPDPSLEASSPWGA